MQVIYHPTIREQLNEHIRKATCEGKKIAKIILTPAEWENLNYEISVAGTFYGITSQTSLEYYGVKLEKGK